MVTEVTFEERPLSWYVGMLGRGEPFASQLWGDGEFAVASGRHGGRLMQNGELARDWLALSLRDALRGDLPGVVRGTDRHFLFPETYGGQDREAVFGMAETVQLAARAVRGEFPTCWVDGTVWDVAARQGQLGPLLGVLRERPCVCVGHPALEGALRFLGLDGFVPIPPQDACAAMPRVTAELFAMARCINLRGAVFLLCMGLSAIPLMEAMRPKKVFDGATWLDLGSTLDVFAGLGAERGWRNELYGDEGRRLDLVARNLEGIT